MVATGAPAGSVTATVVWPLADLDVGVGGRDGRLDLAADGQVERADVAAEAGAAGGGQQRHGDDGGHQRRAPPGGAGAAGPCAAVVGRERGERGGLVGHPWTRILSTPPTRGRAASAAPSRESGGAAGVGGGALLNVDRNRLPVLAHPHY